MQREVEMSHDYSAAQEQLAVGTDGNHWFNGYDHRRNWIILHGTAGGGNAANIAAWFKTAPNSVHYIINTDGTVVQCVPETDSAWGNGQCEGGCDAWWWAFPNQNMVTFSIEHVKDVQNADPLTPAQQAASFQLIQHLCQTWHIPARQADGNGGITGHFSLLPIQRANCPGPYPWAALWAYLTPDPADPMNPKITLPQGWSDDGTTLTSPPVPSMDKHTFPVVRGFRQALLTTPGLFYALGNPIEAEHAVQDVGEDGVHGAGVRQLFELGGLGWTATEQVFRLFTGLQWLRAMQSHTVAYAAVNDDE